MDVHNRFERRSLRDVLVAQGVLSVPLADELMSSAREENEPFGAVVVEAGHLTAWDLAKAVITHYQMPYLPLQGFRYDAELAEGLPTATLYHYNILPVGRFGKVRSFAVIEPPSRDCITELQETCGNNLFFFVSEVQEIQRLLNDNVKVVDAKGDTSWTAVFDTAHQSVLSEDVPAEDADGEAQVVDGDDAVAEASKLEE
jgi:hypothetical protein